MTVDEYLGQGGVHFAESVYQQLRHLVLHALLLLSFQSLVLVEEVHVDAHGLVDLVTLAVHLHLDLADLLSHLGLVAE